MALGAVVPIYNLPELEGKTVRFSGESLAGIFLGEITKWDDAKIKADNPNLDAAEQGHRRRPPLGQQRHVVHLHGLPLKRQPGLEEQGRHGDRRQLADWPRRAGQPGRDERGQAEPVLDRLRGADLRAPAEAAARRGQEQGRPVRLADDREHDGGSGRHVVRHPGRHARLDRERARRQPRTRSPASPGFSRTRRSRRRRRQLR